jgi:peptidyl-prolyl cis-trans isomerase C
MYSSQILRAALTLALMSGAGGAFAQAASKDAAKGAAPASASGPLATVNGIAIPRARADILVRAQTGRGQPDNEQMRGAVREHLINQEVLVQEATRSGLAKRADIQTQVELARQEALANAFLSDYMRQNPVTDAEVQKEYDNAKALAGDKEYRARHILVETEDEAKKLIADLQKGGKFEDLAQKSSKDPGSKDKGGDLDWNVPNNYDKAFADAMVKLDKGKTSEAPVRSRFGFHIIRLDDVRALRFPPVAEVKARLQEQMARRKVDALVRDLRAKAKVE